MFSSTKTPTESNKSNDWLGLTGGSSDDEELAPRITQKIEPAITTLAKKIPIAPVKETPAIVPEAPKKSVLDDLLEDDRRALKEKPTHTPAVLPNNTASEFWLDERTTANKRPATAGIPKTSSFTENQPTKSSTKPLFDPKTDFGMNKS